MAYRCSTTPTRGPQGRLVRLSHLGIVLYLCKAREGSWLDILSLALPPDPMGWCHVPLALPLPHKILSFVTLVFFVCACLQVQEPLA